jgi:energy-coupling factor transport system ATP-binding protein
MEVPGMKLSLAGVTVVRGDWSLSAEGVFEDGIHLVSGDTGSGKSTLALMLAGLLPPASGAIEGEGIESAMITFQFPEFHITGPDLEGECRTWDLDPSLVLKDTNLAGKKNMHPLDLSRGELKRLILACVIAKNHDLLVLDEPFSSLDSREKERFCATVSGRKTGITIIFTHERVHFPRVSRIWEIQGGVLHDRGRLPMALSQWNRAPAVIKNLIARGRTPENISQADLLEAACRT